MGRCIPAISNWHLRLSNFEAKIKANKDVCFSPNKNGRDLGESIYYNFKKNSPLLDLNQPSK